MLATQLNIPAKFASGETVKYERALGDFPADGGWQLTLYLAGKKAFDKQAGANGSNFVVELLPNETSNLLPGVYNWIERVTNGQETHDVASGRLLITPDLAAATDGSQQEWAEKAVELLRDSLTGRMTEEMQAMQINGRSIAMTPAKDRIVLLNYLEARLNGSLVGSPTRTILFKFVNP
jgi:hypothetical protein